MQPDSALLRKYNTSAPRYTSYPTVPCWDHAPDEATWADEVEFTFRSAPKGQEGISLYIHLPYCESLCTYCGCNTRITVNHAVEAPYIAAVLKEWEMYCRLFAARPLLKELHLGGGTPTFFSAANLHLLITGILASADVHPDASLGVEAHPNSTSAEHLSTLFALGFRRLSLGIQDFDPEVQRIVNRVQPFSVVQEVTETARRIGYSSINFDLIYGLPKQTRQSVSHTISLTRQLRPDRIAFYSYAHIPWIKPGQRSFTEADLPDDESKRALYETGRQLLTEAGYEDIGMDHFALPDDSLCRAAHNGTLHRNFMGYTTAPTRLLIGLGVSAISDSWFAYAQNAKTVEDYLNAVNENRLPIFRGHLLTPEDVQLRQHILDLMCRYHTAWPADAETHELYANIRERLRIPESDGLVVVDELGVTITELGKAFLRNTCMAFDARLHRMTRSDEVFSKAV